MIRRFLETGETIHGVPLPREGPRFPGGELATLFATDRTDRVTYIAQGWKVTDPAALTDIGLVPEHETLIEIRARRAPHLLSACTQRRRSADVSSSCLARLSASSSGRSSIRLTGWKPVTVRRQLRE